LLFTTPSDHHQALGYETPDHDYHASVGGRSLIVDKLANGEREQEKDGSTGQRRAAARDGDGHSLN